MVLNVHRNHEAYWGRGERWVGGGGGKGVWRWGKREIIYLLLHRHHQNDFCIKVGSDESHFNVTYNRRSSEIQGTALGKCLKAWPVYIQVHACGCRCGSNGRRSSTQWPRPRSGTTPLPPAGQESSSLEFRPT